MAEYNFNVTGKQRKALVKKIAEIMGTESVYRAAPTFAYDIGDHLSVDVDGKLIVDDGFAQDVLDELLKKLYDLGFSYFTGDNPDVISIEVPKSKLSQTGYRNLETLVHAKKELFSRAFRRRDLKLVTDDEKISFPWFPGDATPEDVKAYTLFVTKLCENAGQVGRVRSRAAEIINEKYEFRTFLLRIGFIGDEYTEARKILMRNLAGNSSFLNGYPKKPITED